MKTLKSFKQFLKENNTMRRSIYELLADPSTPAFIRKAFVPDISEFRSNVLGLADEHEINLNKDYITKFIEQHSEATGTPKELYAACFEAIMFEKANEMLDKQALIPQDSKYAMQNPSNEVVIDIFNDLGLATSQIQTANKLIDILDND